MVLIHHEVLDTQVLKNKISSTRKVIHGNTTYAAITKKSKNITVFGDNITNRIKKKEINKFARENVFLKSFSGATVKDTPTYVEPTVESKVCDTEIINVGNNDIPNKILSTCDISDSIINVWIKCRNCGVVNNVMISLITRRKMSINLQERINEVNDFLKAKCFEKQFIFVDNKNINEDDISDAFLHLCFSGSCKLANNFISSIN